MLVCQHSVNVSETRELYKILYQGFNTRPDLLMMLIKGAKTGARWQSATDFFPGSGF